MFTMARWDITRLHRSPSFVADMPVGGKICTCETGHLPLFCDNHGRERGGKLGQEHGPLATPVRFHDRQEGSKRVASVACELSSEQSARPANQAFPDRRLESTRECGRVRRSHVEHVKGIAWLKS